MSLSFSYILALDPGLTGTGWALFDAQKRILLRTNVFFPQRGEGRGHYLNGLKNGASMFRSLIIHEIKGKEFQTQVILEEPTLWSGSALSMSAGTRGDLHKLSAFFGMLTATAHINMLSARAIPVNQWKGQMSKEAVIHRIKKRYEEHRFHLAEGEKWVPLQNHSADAIGLGLYVLGVL